MMCSRLLACGRHHPRATAGGRRAAAAAVQPLARALLLVACACREWSTTAAGAAAVAVCHHRLRQYAARQGASDPRVSPRGAGSSDRAVGGGASLHRNAHITSPARWPACPALCRSIAKKFRNIHAVERQLADLQMALHVNVGPRRQVGRRRGRQRCAQKAGSRGAGNLSR